MLVFIIHKAECRGFDSVYMMLDKVSVNDESRRKIYVGLTRAKNELYVNYNNEIFDRFDVEVRR